MTKPIHAGVRGEKLWGGVWFEALCSPFLWTRSPVLLHILAFYGAYRECWLIFFFSSAQKVLIFSKQNFQVANEQKFKSCKFCSCSLWEEENCIHRICKMYQNVEKSIDWQLWIFTSLFNCLKSASWEIALDLAAIHVEDGSSFGRRTRRLKCGWYLVKKKKREGKESREDNREVTTREAGRSLVS